MQARDIERWLAKILGGDDEGLGAEEILTDAEVAKHIVRVWTLIEAIDQRFRPKDALEELRGDAKTHGEIHVSMAMLRARAIENNREFLARCRRERDARDRELRAAQEAYIREQVELGQLANVPAWWGSSEEQSAA